MHRTTLQGRALLPAATLLLATACAEPGGPAPSSATTPSLATRDARPLAHWQRIGVMDAAGALALTASGAILAAHDQQGLFRSDDDGLTWRHVEGVTTGVTSLAVSPRGDIFAGTSAGVLRSRDGGVNWSPAGLEERYIAVLGTDDAGAVYAGSPGFTGGLYRGVGEFPSWTRIYVPLSPRDFMITYVSSRKGDLFLGTYAEGEHWLRDGAVTWETFWSLYAFGGFAPPTTAMLETERGALLTSFFDGVLRSDDRSSDDENRQWRQVFSGKAVQRLTPDGNGGVLATTTDGEVHRSTDDGASWTQIAAGVPRAFTQAFVITPSGRMILGTYEGVFRSVPVR